MNILVTGASGFVGSQIVIDLVAQGYQVTCSVRNVNFTKKLFPECDMSAIVSVFFYLNSLLKIY